MRNKFAGDDEEDNEEYCASEDEELDDVNVETIADAYMMSVAWSYKKLIVYILSCLCLDLYEPST